jgi:penicillin-binding protein 1B
VVEQGTARNLHNLLGNDVLVAGKTGTTNERRDSWFVGYTRNRVGVSWVGLDDNRPAGVTGGNAAMRIWAELFRQLPIEAVELHMPEGAGFTWVDIQQQALTGPGCPGAVHIPFIKGSEPTSRTACLEKLDRKDKKSLWRKWFEGKD